MDLDALIGEIATRHGVAVSRDDPVMILATLNERLIEESREAQRQLLEEFRHEMAGASHAGSRRASNARKVCCSRRARRAALQRRRVSSTTARR